MDENEEIPSWDIINLDCWDDEASFGIRCSGKLFYVYVRAEDVESWSRKAELLELLPKVMDDYDSEEALYDLITDAIIVILRAHRSRTIDPVHLTLQQYYNPEICCFKLISDGDGLTHLPWTKDRPDLPGTAPLLLLSNLPDCCLAILHLDAQEIRVLPPYDSRAVDDVLSDAPAKVIIHGDTAQYFFKPVRDDGSFLREYRILMEFKQRRMNQDHRLSKIHGLVHYSNEPDHILGMLLPWIDNNGTLADYIDRDRITQPLTQKWEQQIKETVSVLHGNGIVWGDVHPANVVIDRKEDAWVIDFDGGYNPEYVDAANMETMEGDLLGVSRIMKKR